MADPAAIPATDHSPFDRIERALVRIEAAAASRTAEIAALGSRNAALRDRMTEAIAALDAVIAREDGG